MNRLLDHARRNAIAYLALFISIGGTSYAAASLPANSVGSRQLKNHSVGAIKFDPKSVGAYVRAWAVIQGGTKVVESHPRARVVSWDPSSGGGSVSWGRSVSDKCFAVATAGRDSVQAAVLAGAHHTFGVHFQVFTNTGQFDPVPPLVAVVALCPEP